VLAQFPGLTHEAAMEGMVVVEENGKVSVGMAAVAALMSRRTGLARAYFLPGIRQVADGVYALIAMNRYRLMGKAVAAGECENGSCQLHFDKKSRTTV
jgi:predicted DCC family thiol-disulfide oxidoreductase YuxK